MATLTINIPDPIAGRVLDALAARYEWSAESGLTKAQFAKAVIIKLLKDAVRSHEGNIATQQANEATNAAVDTEIVLS